MTYEKTTMNILRLIYAAQLPDKQLMRSIGYSYNSTGRKIRELINRNWIEEIKIKGEKVLRLTSEGNEILRKEGISSIQTDHNLRSRIEGEEKKLRQIKFATVMQVLNQYVPNFVSEYLAFESAGENNNSKVRGLTKSEQLSILKSAMEAKAENGDNWYMSVRELRGVDPESMRNLTAVRAQGILHFPTGNFVVYNHMRKKMRKYGNFDEKFKTLAIDLTGEHPKGSISFAKSFKVAIDIIQNTPDNQRSGFILSSGLYENQFYVPLTHEGAKQIELYTIPNFREKVRARLIDEADIDRARNIIYDGFGKDGCIYFLGFGCNLSEIWSLHERRRFNLLPKAKIYCLAHQAYFYKTLFGENVEIITVSIEALKKYCE